GYQVFDGKVSFENERAVTDFLGAAREYQRVPPRELLDALREEFRVLIAQGTLLGSEPSVRSFRPTLGAASSPAPATPAALFSDFGEERTALGAALLTVPVSRYLPLVKDKPPESELRTRYEKYKDQEPSPTSREPGFKEPRRIRVEYLYASPEDPYY